MTQHKNVYSALAAAQAEMEPARKSADNPHFKSKYADLSAVVDAVRPALNKHGIAHFHIPTQTELGHFMQTVLYHGESDTSISCDVPLIFGKNDMQGYKSAATYAKRIGLESVTGTAPEDDDGNAAADSTRKGAVIDQPKSWAQTIIDELPSDATQAQKAEAIANALCDNVKRKKTAGELANEWDRRKSLIDDLEKRFPALHQRVSQAFEERGEAIAAKVAAQ